MELAGYFVEVWKRPSVFLKICLVLLKCNAQSLADHPVINSPTSIEGIIILWKGGSLFILLIDSSRWIQNVHFEEVEQDLLTLITIFAKTIDTGKKALVSIGRSYKVDCASILLWLLTSGMWLVCDDFGDLLQFTPVKSHFPKLRGIFISGKYS